MEQEQTQEQDLDTTADMTPEEAKASLGLATRLNEQMLMSMAPQQPIEGSETPENGSESEVESGSEEMGEEDDSEAKMAEMKESMKKEIIEEVKAEIMGTLKEALDEE